MTSDPALQRYCGIDDMDAWQRICGAELAWPAPIDASLLQQFALPMLARLLRGVEAGERPALAINGPVGAGKSSLIQVLMAAASRVGLRLGAASIDDFYLPWATREHALAGNPFGVNRVPPGSHDTVLLTSSLQRWRRGGIWDCPRFDKRLRGGQGDRTGHVQSDCDALVLEAWLVGCHPSLPGQSARSLVAKGQALGLSEEEAAWLPRWDHQLLAYQPQ